MFKIRYHYGSCVNQSGIFTVYSVSDDYFLIYINKHWKWIKMTETEPIENNIGMQLV